jgi:hypothetical protein
MNRQGNVEALSAPKDSHLLLRPIAPEHSDRSANEGVGRNLRLSRSSRGRERLVKPATTCLRRRRIRR